MPNVERTPVPNVPGDSRSSSRPAGTRFRPADGSPAGTRPAGSHRAGAAHRAQPAAHAPRPTVRTSGARFSANGSVQPAYARRAARPARKSPAPVIIGALAVVAVAVCLCLLVLPRVLDAVLGGGESAVPAGQEVTLTVPEGASGDAIASLLSKNHVIEDPSTYYATVKKLNADTALKPGDYRFTTGQDPAAVVKQLMEGPNVEGAKLTVQEGLTVDQTAARVEEAYGIKAADFKAQAKASSYEADYPFLKGAYNDSLEGYLYPKTYSLSDHPTADEVIRAMLDQFKAETQGLDLASGPNGLSAQELITVASLIERETAVEAERPTVASVIYNRLAADMPLQIDAAIVYARGGGSQAVSNDDLKIDSPYNVYVNRGLTPGPICSPSISSIKAALSPASTDYLYYVASPAGDGSHNFSADYDRFLKDKAEYEASLS